MILSSVISVLVLISLAEWGVECEAERESCSLSHWSKFKERFGKRYDSLAEDRRRRGLFCRSLRWIEETNARNLTQRVALNRFADQNRHEFASKQMELYDGLPILSESMITKINPKLLAEDLPSEKDWRGDARVVGPVRDELGCDSGWAFATVGLLEGLEHKRDNRLTEVVPLSVQQLIDCDDLDGTGCDRKSAQIKSIT